jgi:serine/threonine protein phosphatase PrpC
MLGNHVTRVQLSNRGQLFGIFDGMGSLPRGGDAARFLGDQLVKFYDHIDQQHADALKELLIGANETIAGWKTPLNSQCKIQRKSDTADQVKSPLCQCK